MESLVSSIRSAARATFSAYRSIPVRWRLAGGSAALTLVILAAFAAIVGALTEGQVRRQFDGQVRSAANRLARQIKPFHDAATKQLNCTQHVALDTFARPDDAQIRVFSDSGQVMCSQNETANPNGLNKPAFLPPHQRGTYEQDGYRVEVRKIGWYPSGEGYLLYARPLSQIDHTLARVRLFLVLGVLGGAVLALLAGLFVARRAMRPIAELTDAAREIERTRDPSLELPYPEADDEVAELARTLDGMLRALDGARGETEAMLQRQRQFIADASHELRTPLTSVLANLELLSEELGGEQAETAHAALRSTRRMRRLVGDLLLLARADAHRVAARRPTDLGQVLIEAAAELEPVADGHELSIDPGRAEIDGVQDDLHRLVLNLLENAVRHTPPGTHVHASTAVEGGQAVLVVSDDGPGIAPELRRRVFDRFVRGGRDGGRGSGLGLAIVRAVAESHQGTVSLDSSAGIGTKFEIRIPAVSDHHPRRAQPRPARVAPDGDRWPS
ncbi:MAG: HAMP domain-containing histidine kinase [Solirubrobacterales bacterium]|nr:HAMP domain-containing histidine kinase [Solirubrobacterales bacterium]MBV9167253.1 HAMP domain-containing histidine kinase [Solirubrobacterales bacterium]